MTEAHQKLVALINSDYILSDDIQFALISELERLEAIEQRHDRLLKILSKVWQGRDVKAEEEFRKEIVL